MPISGIDAIPLDAQLRVPFKFGNVVRTASSNVLIRIEADGAVGWGEACPVPQLTGETRESILALVLERIAPVLIGQDPVAWRPLTDRVRACLYDCPATTAGIETALLDLAGKVVGLGVSELLGGRYRDAIEVHGSVGWDEDPQVMVETALAQRERFSTLKLYVGRDDLRSDLDRIERVREAVGPDHPFIVDVNGLWSPIDALRAGARLADAYVTILEQPVARADQRGMATVTRFYGEHHGIAVAGDESILSAQEALAAASAASMHMVNVGMTKLGGPAAAHGVAMLATAANLSTLVGSVVEMGVATVAGLHMAAALPRLPAPSYLGSHHKYVRQITSPIEMGSNGTIPVPAGPGLGIKVDEEAVASLDMRRLK